MIINGVPIDDAKLEAARTDFRQSNRSYGKGKLSFEKLLNLYTQDYSLSDIAKKDGITTAGSSWKYRRFFSEILGEESGQARRKVRNAKRRAAATKKIPKKSILAFVIGEAKRLGYNAEPISSKQPPFFHKRRVMVKGKLGLVHHLTFVDSFAVGTKRECGLLHFGGSIQHDFRIVITDFPERPRRTFIFPANILPITEQLYIHADKIEEIFKNHRSRIDCWAYEGDDAWHHQFD